jgi:hypothetical protein
MKNAAFTACVFKVREIFDAKIIDILGVRDGVV